MIKNCSASGAAAPDPASHTPINYTALTVLKHFFTASFLMMMTLNSRGYTRAGLENKVALLGIKPVFTK